MSEFKQIIGRGTRVRDDYGKLWFSILDYTGSATRLFADSDFDGDPALVSEEKIDNAGATYETTIIEETPVVEDGCVQDEYCLAGVVIDDDAKEPRKYFVDGGQVEIAAHLVYELDPDGKQLRVVKYSDYAADKIRTLFPGAIRMREQWANPKERAEVISQLEERGISFSELAESVGQPEADPFDLLCHLAFNAPLRTRRERAERLKNDRKDFFDHFSSEARAILEELLEKYAQHGTAQFVVPDILKVPPISERGNVIEIANYFGGAEKLRESVNELQTLLYAI
jgi:type I restriction enzyme R subunit